MRELSLLLAELQDLAYGRLVAQIPEDEYFARLNRKWKIDIYQLEYLVTRGKFTNSPRFLRRLHAWNMGRCRVCRSTSTAPAATAV